VTVDVWSQVPVAEAGDVPLAEVLLGGCRVLSGASQPPTALHTVPDGQQPYIQQIVPGGHVNSNIRRGLLTTLRSTYRCRTDCVGRQASDSKCRHMHLSRIGPDTLLGHTRRGGEDREPRKRRERVGMPKAAAL